MVTNKETMEIGMLNKIEMGMLEGIWQDLIQILWDHLGMDRDLSNAINAKDGDILIEYAHPKEI